MSDKDSMTRAMDQRWTVGEEAPECPQIAGTGPNSSEEAQAHPSPVEIAFAAAVVKAKADPYDPEPQAACVPYRADLVWCARCGAAKEAHSHDDSPSLAERASWDSINRDRIAAHEECLALKARDYWRDDGNPLPDDFEGRAEFAESLLKHDAPKSEKFGDVLVTLLKLAVSAGSRAEFAESLLTAMAFDHQRLAVRDHYTCEEGDGSCVFCDSARWNRRGRPH